MTPELTAPQAAVDFVVTDPPRAPVDQWGTGVVEPGPVQVIGPPFLPRGTACVCAACGGFSVVDLDGIVNGTTWTCFHCETETVVDMGTVEGRAAKHACRCTVRRMIDEVLPVCDCGLDVAIAQADAALAAARGGRK